MKILFVARAYPPTTGGMERLAYDLHGALAAKCSVHLVKWGQRNRTILLPFIVGLLFIRSIWVLSQKSIDIIHMQDGLLAPMGLVLKKLFRKPLTVEIHGLDITFNNRAYQAIIPWALKRADTVICISEAARSEVVARGVTVHKTVVIPVGITDDLYTGNKKNARLQLEQTLGISLIGKTVLLTVGRLVKRKGVDWFVRSVMPMLLTKKADIVYLVAGEGVDRPTIESSIKKLGAEKNIFLMGRVDDSVMKALYNGADIFVMPNIPVQGDMEGFGRVLLEASLCELTVVAAALEGIKDAITNGKNGLLVRPRDRTGFATQILELEKNKSELKGFGKPSRTFTLDNYGWEPVSARYIETYAELLEKAGDN